MRSADISMLMIIQMYSSTLHTKICVIFFLILTFSALRVSLFFLKKIETSDMSRPEYIQ